MTPALPTGRNGQFLALGLTILVLAAFWLGVVMPVIDWHGERAEALVRKAALVQRMEALVATRAAVQEQAKAVAAGGAGETALLEGDSESVAGATLQELLQARGMPPAEYRLAREEGPDHQKLFHVEVWSLGERLASGDGNTKKEAEQSAAIAALIQLGAEEN